MIEGWRRNLYVIWLATFASIAGASLAMPFMPLFINRDLGVTDPGMAAIWTGLATAGSGIVQAIMSPIWGVMADRHGRKPMLVRAQFAIGASNAITAFVIAPWQLVGIRLVQGAFSGVVGASRALVASSVPRERVPYAMGVIQSATFTGQTLGPTIGGILGSTVGFRWALIGTGCVNVAAGTLALLFVKEHHDSTSDHGAGAGRRQRGRSSGGLRALVSSRAVLTLCVIFYLSTAASAAIRPVLALLLEEIDPGEDVAIQSGLCFAMLGVAGTVSSIGSGRLGDKIGMKRLLIGAGFVAMVSAMAVARASSSTLVIAIMFGVGLGQGAMWSSSAALLSLHSPASRQGSAFGVLTSAQALANASGPLVGSLVASAYDFHTPFLVIAASLLLASLLGMTVPPPPPHDAAEVAVA